MSRPWRPPPGKTIEIQHLRTTPLSVVSRARWIASCAFPTSGTVVTEVPVGESASFPLFRLGEYEVTLRELDNSKRPMQDLQIRLHIIPSRTGTSSSTTTSTTSTAARKPLPEELGPQWWWMGDRWYPFEPSDCTLLEQFLESNNMNRMDAARVKLSSGNRTVNLLSMTQRNHTSGNVRKIRYTGHKIRPFTIPPVPSCRYGLTQFTHPAETPPADECLLLMMPNDVLVNILTSLLSYCKCTCHTGQFYVDEAVTTLCNVSLVHSRFHTPIPDLNTRTIPEEVAICFCAKAGVNINAKPSGFRLITTTFHALELLLLSDPKVIERDNKLKRDLHNRAFGLCGYGMFVCKVPQEREAARQEILRRWLQVDATMKTEVEAPGVPSCFTGDGDVLMADNSLKKVEHIEVGDLVLTELGTPRAIARVEVLETQCEKSMVILSGLALTPGHPVLVRNEWVHPFEIGTLQKMYIDRLYNFELEGGPEVTDHSFVINGLTLAALGKDCGTKMTTGWPKADAMWGRGYWQTPASAWAKRKLAG
ncbi:hypothetical protein Pelo_12169 [Pelomyxa schiedti]|nr:hypothetical protein Pelo_12169 [Pelomyxa schiedti]